MSTRANIIISEEGTNESKCIYHHCDGYPKGVGDEVINFIRDYISSEPEDVGMESLNKYIIFEDSTYQPARDLAGDAEYVYSIFIAECITLQIHERRNWEEDDYRTWDLIELHKFYF